jgi:hypothetical protein
MMRCLFNDKWLLRDSLNKKSYNKCFKEKTLRNLFKGEAAVGFIEILERKVLKGVVSLEEF